MPKYYLIVNKDYRMKIIKKGKKGKKGWNIINIYTILIRTKGD